MKLAGVLLLLLPALARAQDAGVIAIPDTGWHLWLDRNAQWSNDELRLPGQMELSGAAETPPTGGWKTLDRNEDLVVRLPATVDQYRWGSRGARAYRSEEYSFAASDTAMRNGAYRGVSWWWRDVDVPESVAGKRLILRVPGASLRAEVYWNNRLVGQDILAGTPFTCDVTDACVPGVPNRIAVRITNPGGRYDGVDTRNLRWGKLLIPSGRGFGGLDAGLSVLATDPVRIADVWVLNTAQARNVNAFVRLVNTSESEAIAAVRLDVAEERNPARRVASAEKKVTVAAGASVVISMPLSHKKADLWTPDAPVLYRLLATVSAQPRQSRSAWKDQRSVRFGFRSITADGAGPAATLRLNGQRLRLYAAVSHGYWGLNGLWPDGELTARETRSARQLGFNCLVARGYPPNSRSLDAHDSIGLLLCLDPGALPSRPVATSSRQGAEAKKESDSAAYAFADAYIEEHILRLVRAQRSHPSLAWYRLRSDCAGGPQHPGALALLRAVHEEDPSRIAVLSSEMHGGLAWMLPWDDSIRTDVGSGGSAAFARAIGLPGAFSGPRLVAPAASPDNHASMLAAIDSAGGFSYDRTDHAELLESYGRFIDERKFRATFPTADSLFAALGAQQAAALGHALETARLEEDASCLVLGDWESTATGGHAGLVDNLRRPKGDPALFARGLRRLQPVLRPDRRVVRAGDTITCDLAVLNETARAHGSTLQLTVTPPGGDEQLAGRFAVPAREADRFVYTVAAGTPVTATQRAGELLLRVRLLPEDIETQERVLVVDSGLGDLPRRIGLASSDPMLTSGVGLGRDAAVEPYQLGRRYDAVIVIERFPHPQSVSLPGVSIARTADAELYRAQHHGAPADFAYLFTGLKSAKATVTFRFAEWQHAAPGARVFDVDINDEPVLSNFDIVAAAGGRNLAIDTSMTVRTLNGCVRITVPRARAGEACFAALRVVSGMRDIAVNCGGPEYTDTAGTVWKPYAAPLRLDHGLLEKVKKGLPMLLLAEGDAAVEGCCRVLGEAGAFTARGHTGTSRARGAGSWMFLRSHPVFEGLAAGGLVMPFLQTPVLDADALLFSGGNAEILAGFGRDHDRDIGAASLVLHFGKGIIILHTLPGIAAMFHAPSLAGLPTEVAAGATTGMPPVAAWRLILNSLRQLKR